MKRAELLTTAHPGARSAEAGRGRRPAVLLAALLATALLQACAPTLPKVVKPVGCAVDDATLALACAAPQPVRDGMTYGDVLGIARLDRMALLECQAFLKSAVNMLAECRRSTDAYSRALDGINDAIDRQGR